MVNQGTILGRVGKIDTRSMQNGNKVTNISMVTSKKYVKDGEKQEKVTWHNVTLFSKLAEIAEKYVAIGDLLYVQGEMDNQKYTGQDGIERSKFLVIGHELKLMPKSKEHKPEPKPEEHYDAGFDDSDIPF
jgi:single-strand DNA-binding protein